jgi:hypothetical protein
MRFGVLVEGAQQFPHSGPRLEQLRLRRSGGDAENLSDLFVCVALHIVEDHDLPHPFGETIQRPFQLLLEKDVAPGWRSGDLFRHRYLPLPLSLSLASRLECRVDGDAVKPRREARVSTKGREGPDGPDPCLLRVILRQIVVTRDPTDHGVDARRIPFVEDPDRAVVPLARLPYQLRFTQLPHLLPACSGPDRGAAFSITWDWMLRAVREVARCHPRSVNLIRLPSFPLVPGPEVELASMRYFWIVFWGVCAVLVVVAGVRVLASVRRGHQRASLSVDDAAVRRIIDEGVLASEEEEPLDLEEIEEEERRFWRETWEEAEEW